MKTTQNWTSLSVDSYYVDYFKGLAKIGFLETNSKDYNYYLVQSNIGKIAILSIADLKNHPNKDWIGGEFRLSMLSKSKEDNPKGITKKLIQQWVEVFDEFSFLVMVTGCDDGHLAFYFRNEDHAIEILNEIETIDELMELTVSVQEIGKKLKDDQSLDNVWIVGDCRN